MMSTVDSERFLGAPLLIGADDRTRLAILEMLVGSTLPPGTPVLSQGLTNDRLWFVLEGSVAVERRQPDGMVAVLATLSGPAMYGTTTFFRSSAPTATIRATSTLRAWTLDHEAHARLRLENPQAAETLALEVVRVLSERFDQLDDRLAELMAEHPEDHPRATEWAKFRARLFEEPAT